MVYVATKYYSNFEASSKLQWCFARNLSWDTNSSNCRWIRTTNFYIKFSQLTHQTKRRNRLRLISGSSPPVVTENCDQKYIQNTISVRGTEGHTKKNKKTWSTLPTSQKSIVTSFVILDLFRVTAQNPLYCGSKSLKSKEDKKTLVSLISQTSGIWIDLLKN